MAACKGVEVLVCWSVLLVSYASMAGCSTAAAGSDGGETWQEVMTAEGAAVVYGASNTYTIYAPDIDSRFVLRFFFGLGSTGDVVRTDTAVTLGGDGDESRLYVCMQGKLEMVDVHPSGGTPQNAIIRVRYNSSDGNYRLQMTELEDSRPVFVQFTGPTSGLFLCDPGVPGSPIRFNSYPSSSHQVVDAIAAA